MNRVHIEPTKFIDVRSGEEHLGFRAWDDEDQSYDNSWDAIPESDEAFFKKVLKECRDEAVNAMLDFCRDARQGLFLGPNYTPWETISKWLEEADA